MDPTPCKQPFKAAKPAAEDAVAVSPPLLALMRHDDDLRLWLHHTGFFDPVRRERVLGSIRKLKAFDEERDKLLLELRTEAGALFHDQPLLSSPPASPGIELASPAPVLALDADAVDVHAAVATEPAVLEPGPVSDAPSYSASTAATSVAASVRADSETSSEKPEAVDERPSLLARARLSVSSTRSPYATQPRTTDTRFFLLKSFDSANVFLSQRDGLWATQAKNGKLFTKAFEECQSVIFFFSINKSRAFQGFARMTSAPDPALRKPRWIQNINLASVTDPFRVEWICKTETDFDALGDLKNPLNDFRSVVVGRDGQEYSSDSGRKMMATLNRSATLAGSACKSARADAAKSALVDRARTSRPRAKSPRPASPPAKSPPPKLASSLWSGRSWRERESRISSGSSAPAAAAAARPPSRADSINLIDC